MMAMKTCIDETHDWLGPWYDGELDELDARRVAEHVAGCPVCSAEVESWRQIDRLLDTDVEAGLLAESVLTAVRAGAASENRSWWLKLAAAAVIAAAIGGLGGQAVTRGQNRASGQTGQELTSLTLLEQSFAPGSLAGIDALASELQADAGEAQ
jgi:anti-sigma factor RsiW